jgi:hypothetical protein
MSPLLVVAIVLLVIVLGLAWFQRRATRDLSTGAAPRAGADPLAPVPTPPADRVRPTMITDPVFGDLTFDGHDSWTRDEDLALADEYIEVLVLAGPDGPQDTHRAWMQAALPRLETIDTEARTVLARAMAPLGLSGDDLTPWQIAIGPAAGETACEGRLYYDSMHAAVDEAYVRSTALWDRLEPHVILVDAEDGSADTPPERVDAWLGRIVYSGERMWSTAEPFRFAGQDVFVVLTAGAEGPTPEHDAWVEALASRARALRADAEALARTARRHVGDPVALTLRIVVIGPDEHGRFIGGLCFDWPGRGDERCDVWSRDHWATLSLDRA